MSRRSKNMVIIMIMMIIIAGFALFSCGAASEQPKMTAYIKSPTGLIIEGEVQNYRTYSSSDIVYVTINGIEYGTQMSNVLIVKEPK